MSDDPGHQTKMAAITKNRKYGKKSLKNHLLWNCWANWAQTMVEWSSDGPLSELCLMAPVRQPRWPPLLKIRKFAKKSLKNYLLWNCWANWAQTMVEWSLGDPLSEFWPTTLARQPIWLPLLKIENSAKNHLKIISSETTGPVGPKLWWNGPLREMCPTTPAANQDGRCY